MKSKRNKKRCFTALLYSLVLFFMACTNKEPKTLLTRKWKYDSEKMVQQAEKRFKAIPAENTTEATSVQVQLLEYRSFLTGIELQFLENGHFAFSGSIDLAGDWQLSETELLLNDKELGQIRYQLVELTEDKLCLGVNQGIRNYEIGKLALDSSFLYFIPSE